MSVTRQSLRLFAEGVPTDETEAEAAIRQSVGGENDSPARQLARFVTEVADNRATGMRVRVIYRRDRFLRGGDQISFLERGYPAARFTEPNENFAHQHQDVRVENGVQFGDLPQFCDFDYIARVARVNAATLWSLANAPGTPKNVQVLTAELTNDTELTWDANQEADLDRYEVVWRPTIEDDWTHVDRRRPGEPGAGQPVEGQRVLRGPRGGPHRHAQPRRVPDADAVASGRRGPVSPGDRLSSRCRVSRRCRTARRRGPGSRRGGRRTWSPGRRGRP